MGNKTECALLAFVHEFGEDYEAIRKRLPEEAFVKVYTFNSARKTMATVIHHGEGCYRVYVKGASEIVLSR